MTSGVLTRTHRGSAADLVRSAVLATGPGRFWGPQDFADLEVPATAVDRALQRLKASGELASVRRGLYYRGRQRPVHRSGRHLQVCEVLWSPEAARTSREHSGAHQVSGAAPVCPCENTRCH